MEKKRILLYVVPAFLCMAGMTILILIWQSACQRAVFTQMSGFCRTLLEENPELETEVISVLQGYERGMTGNSFLSRYGYEAADFSPKMGESGYPLLFSAGLTAVVSAAVFFLSQKEKQRIRGKISGLTDYLERINMGARGIDCDGSDCTGILLPEKEDEFAHLLDEIYKTVTHLYATRDAAERARESFAENLANIAHQLKTPLTAALLSLQLMEAKTPNPYAEPVRKQMKRLNRLEEALLSLSRIDSGSLHLERVPVDVYTVLNLAAENLAGLLEEARIQVEIPDCGSIIFPGDLEWTMEALMNLMKNCLEHSPAGSCIRCSYSENPLYVQILIRDEGEGFAEEDIPHLFERFFRGKNASEGSVGIGLSLARAVFERQNGTLTARNITEDGRTAGACFEIHIYRN